jgi:glutamate--cysteine ligase
VRPGIAARARGAEFRGRPLADVAARVLEIAGGGLARRARLNKSGRDEGIHLERIAALAHKGWSPADALLDGLKADDGDLRHEMLSRARI